MEAVRDQCAAVVAEVVDERGDNGATAEGGEDGVCDRIDVEALGASLAEVLQSSLALGLPLSRRRRKANFLRGILFRGGLCVVEDRFHVWIVYSFVKLCVPVPNRVVVVCTVFFGEGEGSVDPFIM